MKRYALLIALMALALSTLACSFSGMNLSRDNATFTVTLNEQEVNEMLDHSTTRIDDRDVLIEDVTRVDMQDGMLRVFGTYEKPDGSTAEGSYDMSVSTKEGELDIQITGVDIEGIELGDRRIQRMNEEMQRELSQTYEESNGEVVFEQATITNDTLTIVVKTNWKNKP